MQQSQEELCLERYSLCFQTTGFATDKWLMVEFVGKSTIDDGGPRREYFDGQ